MKTAAYVINWNSGELIARCIESLKAQSLDEIVVIDNGSTDGSCELAERLGATVVRNGRNTGYAAAANQALKDAISKGAAFALVVNPDAVLSDGAAEALVRALEDDPAAAVASPLVVSESTGLVEAAWYEFNFRHMIVRPAGAGERPERFAETKAVPAVAGVAWMFRTSAMNEVGFLNEEFFAYHEDVEWCYRAALKGKKALLVPSARALHAGFRGDPSGRIIKAYFTARNSVLFAKRWLTGKRRMKFGAFLLSSIPVYFLRGAVDETASWKLKGIRDGFSGKLDHDIRRMLGI